jgi:protease I
MTKRAAKPGEAPLTGKRIAILATHGFEQVELTEPRKALDEAGAKTVVIAPAAGHIRGWKSKEWGDSVAVDVALEDADPDDYDALMLPGGALNPDQLRLDERAVKFVRSFFEHSKPVAAICHAPIMLIEANVIKDRRVTSWPSLKTDLRNAGAQWTGEEVVVDRNLVTSRKPEDIPAFNARMIHEFAAGAPSSRQDRSTVEV